jgi:hypothetical protein
LSKLPQDVPTRQRRSSASPFRRWLAVADTVIIILAEDVKHERGRMFIGSIVVGTAIVIICDF